MSATTAVDGPEVTRVALRNVFSEDESSVFSEDESCKETRSARAQPRVACGLRYSGEGELVSITSGWPPRVTCTLRALDCSVTGIVIVSTPWS